VKVVQLDEFGNELNLMNGKGLPDKHQFKRLNPILVNGVIRVGGRLVNSNFQFDKKHPMLLPKDHRFTRMLINDYHMRYLHAGPQNLLSILREKFWIVLDSEWKKFFVFF
jgi:hypothetical protein